jgi:hypothetical protein
MKQQLFLLRRRAAGLAFLCLAALPAAGQQALLDLAYQPQAAYGWVQPAGLLADSARFRAGFFGGAESASNSFSRRYLTLADTYLDSEAKEEFLGQLKSRNLLEIGAWGGALASFRRHSLLFSAGYLYHSDFQASFGDASARLALYGNAPFAGDTLRDAELGFYRGQRQDIAFGISLPWKIFRFGLRLKAISIGSLQLLQEAEYAFFTSAQGEVLALDLRYDAFRATGRAWGMAADVGMQAQLSPRWSSEVSFLDIGAVRASGFRRSADAEARFEGLDLSRLADFDFSEGLLQVYSDSLREVVLPDSAAHEFRYALSFLYRAGFRWQASDRSQLSLMIHGSGAQPEHPLLLLLGEQRFSWLTLGLSLRYRQNDGPSLGGWAAARIARKGWEADFFAASTQSPLLGFLSPAFQRGINGQAGLTIRY